VARGILAQGRPGNEGVELMSERLAEHGGPKSPRPG
jgi:hypothetical protein